jgi:hypothetical protein
MLNALPPRVPPLSDAARDLDRALGHPRIASYQALLAHVAREHESLQVANELLREWLDIPAHVYSAQFEGRVLDYLSTQEVEGHG